MHSYIYTCTCIMVLASFFLPSASLINMYMYQQHALQRKASLTRPFAYPQMSLVPSVLMSTADTAPQKLTTKDIRENDEEYSRRFINYNYTLCVHERAHKTDMSTCYYTQGSSSVFALP